MFRICLLLISIWPLFGQQVGLKRYMDFLEVAPGSTIADKVKALETIGVSLNQEGLRDLSRMTEQRKLLSPYSDPQRSAPAIRPFTTPLGSPQLRSSDGEGKYLGDLNSNRYDPNSVANPYGEYGSRYSPNSINNPYGKYGSQYSPYSANNPYAVEAPVVVAPNGQSLGRYSSNPYAPDSTSNRFGEHGNPYNPNSINNRYGQYGSPYSPNSINNRYGGTVGSPRVPAGVDTPYEFPQRLPNYRRP